jgi:hypothetical protein
MENFNRESKKESIINKSTSNLYLLAVTDARCFCQKFSGFIMTTWLTTSVLYCSCNTFNIIFVQEDVLLLPRISMISVNPFAFDSMLGGLV